MRNKALSTASDFRMLALEVPAQYPDLGLNLKIDRIWEKSEPRGALLPLKVKEPHTPPHWQKWNEVNF